MTMSRRLIIKFFMFLVIQFKIRGQHIL